MGKITTNERVNFFSSNILLAYFCQICGKISQTVIEKKKTTKTSNLELQKHNPGEMLKWLSDYNFITHTIYVIRHSVDYFQNQKWLRMTKDNQLATNWPREVIEILVICLVTFGPKITGLEGGHTKTKHKGNLTIE